MFLFYKNICIGVDYKRTCYPFVPFLPHLQADPFNSVKNGTMEHCRFINNLLTTTTEHSGTLQYIPPLDTRKHLIP